MKKSLSLLLALSMLLGLLTTTALAAGEYTITAPDNNHVYEIYQIFVGDLSEKTLSNVVWGQNGTGTVGEAVESTVLDEIAAVTGTDTNKLAVITKYVNLNSTAVEIVGGVDKPDTDVDERKATVTVPAGYYLIKDVDNALQGADDAYTLFLVEVVGNVDITPKAEKPTFQKKVMDTNDSVADSTTDWQDSADYDIGDSVPFQLTGKVAENYDDYAAYKFVFHDKESAGLAFESSSVKVYVDGTLITGGYEVVTETEDDCTFEIVFENLKNTAAKAGSVITVEYTATLNENAVLGAAGNPNEAYLEYSNNPNVGHNGETGQTPTDKVIVFTYKVDVNKITKNPAYDENVEGSEEFIALDGAGFTLYKWDVAAEDWDVVGGELTGTTTFTWEGLDDGNYKLVETTTPPGYNTIEPIEFIVSATHDEESDNPQLIELTGGDKFTGEVRKDNDDKEWPTGTLTADVVNMKGMELPETGGMGTTLFYVIGGLMVVGAAVLLIAKKRTGDEA